MIRLKQFIKIDINITSYIFILIMNFETLLNKINEFNNISILEKSEEKTISRFQEYELSQFNWNMTKRNYYQDLREEKKGFKQYPKKQFSNIDLIQTQLDKNTFGRKWSKLDKVSKLKKIDEYIHTLVDTHTLDVSNKTLLKKYVYSLFNKGKIKNKMVEYNSNVFKIVKIEIIETYIETINK